MFYFQRLYFIVSLTLTQANIFKCQTWQYGGYFFKENWNVFKFSQTYMLGMKLKLRTKSST
jgi:hypothetical protein